MALTQNQTKFIGGTQLIINALGASVFPYKFQTGNASAGGMLQLVSGSTTFIVPNAVSGASIGGATALTTIVGWPIPTSAPWAWEGPANFYLATASATAVISAQIFYTGEGATLA